MPSFVKRRKATENPAGGVNPALEPNVGQYGWTSYDAASVNQLIQYVDECKKYAEIAKGAADYIETKFDDLKDLITYLESIYAKIKPIADDIEKIEIDVTRMHTEVMVARVEVDLDRIEAGKSAAGAKLSEETSIEAASSAFRSKLSAKDSEDQSLIYLEESRGLAEELRQGQVYRGTWNPKDLAWPDNGGTNSVWDVILDTGTSDIVFEGFVWHAGDRLLYIVAETKYDQLKTGSGVLSVNGKAGAVTITLEELGGLPANGNPTVNGNLTITGNLTVRGNEIEMANLNVVGDLSERGHLVYTTGRKPAPQEIGAIPDTATINGKPVNTNPTLTYTDVAAYPKLGGQLDGPLLASHVKNAIVLKNQSSISYQDQANTVFHTFSKDNNLTWAHGNNGENTLMALSSTGTLSTSGPQYASIAHIANASDSSTQIGIEAPNGANPYISYKSPTTTAPVVGITFKGDEIAFSQRPAAGSMRISTDAGLKFSPNSDLGGISWGMGIDPNGWLGIHQYSNGAWVQAPIQIDPNGRTIHVNNTLEAAAVTCGGYYKSARAQSPVGMEMEIPGAHARMMWMDSAGNLNFSSSNGGGAEAVRLMAINGDQAVVYGRVYGRVYSMSWGGTATFSGTAVNDYYAVPNGSWWPLIGSPTTVRTGAGGSDGYSHRWSMGHYRTPGDNNGDVVLNVVGDGLLRNNLRFHFTSYGSLSCEGTHDGTSWWVGSGGYLGGSTYGAAGNIIQWCMNSFVPLSDIRYKNVLGDSTESATDIVKQLKFKRFEWTEGDRAGETVEIGLIAQEVEAIDPHYTKDVQTFDADGNVEADMKALDTAALLALALKTIQEQAEKIEDLETRIEALEGRP